MMAPVENQAQYDVFISYASIDRDQVQKLVEKLEGDKFRVWYDQRQISRGQVTLGQLADAIAASAHMIACLSDAYVDREFTKFELDLNQSLDPANIRNRTIPVLIQPLTRPLPNQILAINRGDLTRPDIYEEEYRRITRNITHVKEDQPEEPARLNIDGLKKKLEMPFKDAEAEPIVTLTQIRIAAESLCRFIYKQDLKIEPGNTSFSALVEHVISAAKLPSSVRMALETVESYGTYAVMDGEEEETTITIDSIRPALAAMEVLRTWFLRKYEKKKDLPVKSTGDEPGERAVVGTEQSPAVTTNVVEQVTEAPVEVQPEKPAVVSKPPVPVEPYQLAGTILVDAIDAWALGGKLLVHEAQSSRLEIWDADACTWHTAGSVPVRRVRYGGADQLAAACWDGNLYLFQGDALASTVKLNGAVGDMAYCAGRWAAGTWKTGLYMLRAGSNVGEALADVLEGVGTIAAEESSEWFVVVDLSGGMGIYNNGRKVAAIAPVEQPGGVLFIGHQILTLDGARLITLNLRGEQQNSEVLGSAPQYGLHASLAAERAYLSTNRCEYTIMNPAGMRRPYYRFQEPHDLASTCRDPEKVLFITGDGCCEYWLGRAMKQTWQDVRAAHFAPDGKTLVIVHPQQVQRYEEKV